MKILIAMLCPATLLACTFGCGQAKPEGLPNLAPCTVKVVQEGTPLPNATVVFHGTSPDADRWPVLALTDADGVATMKTAGDFYGAPVAEYTVTVSAEEVVDKGIDPNDKSEFPAPRVTTYSLVSPEYGDAATSPLKVSVAAGKNHFDLDVGKKVHTLYKPDGKH
ncbi:MAG: hypothetical protein Q4G68_01840 [Planctomycetia bacterium]|nr:hypothetical protein [Planctomycetia bacterium]